MEISGVVLLLYVVLWSFFYGFLSHYIARRSVTEWINRFDRDKNPAGADLIVHLLGPVLDEIRNDQDLTLQGFKESFFKSVAPQVREAKQMVREMNPMGAALDALTKDNPLLGLIMSHVKLPEINLPAQDSSSGAGLNDNGTELSAFTPGRIK